jgi:hypothetical protein
VRLRDANRTYDFYRVGTLFVPTRIAWPADKNLSLRFMPFTIFNRNAWHDETVPTLRFCRRIAVTHGLKSWCFPRSDFGFKQPQHSASISLTYRRSMCAAL